MQNNASQHPSHNQLQYIEIEEFQRRFQQKEFQQSLLLDIREQEELTGPLGHLPGIYHIPLEQLFVRLGEIQMYRDQEVIVICRRANRAIDGAHILRQANFKYVYILEGGMLAYRML